MGVDYSANFGIGYKIKKVSEEVLEEYDVDIGYFFDEKLQPYKDEVSYFETGYGRYTGEDNEYFLVLKNPLSILDLTHVKETLDVVIYELGLETDSEFGLVGGLLVW